MQLISDVSSMSAADEGQLRRAFTRKDGERRIATYAKRFIEGAQSRGVPPDAAKKIVAKLNGSLYVP